jgi:hypothetical protein
MSTEFGSFEPVAAICREQGSYIDEAVWEAGCTGKINISNCHTFTPCHAAFARAVELIKRSAERRKLVDRPIPTDVMPDSVSHQLAELLNSTAGFVEQIEPRFNRPVDPWEIDACAAAEKTFAPVIEDLEQGVMKEARIIMEGDRAIVLQKLVTLRAKSGLTLQDMTIGRSRYPAGTLVRLPHEMPSSERGKHLVDAEDVGWIEPMRLTSFAALPGERTAMLRQFVGYSAAPRVLRETAIGEVADIATKAALSAELQLT